MALVLAILNALAALPAIAGYVETFAGVIASWWVQRQKSATLSAIADAAALAARAQTDEERYAATDAWHNVFSGSRVSQQ